MTTEPVSKFKEFLNSHVMENGMDANDYILKSAYEGRDRVILSINDMRLFDNSLVQELISDPAGKLPFFEEEISTIANKKMFLGFNGSLGEYSKNPRTLSSLFLGKMISIEGIVTSCSICRPKVMKSVHYNTNKNIFYEKDYRDATMITKLPITNTTYPTRDVDGTLLTTEFGLSDYFDYQTVVIQEMPEKSPPGQLPRSVEVILTFDLVDSVKPGDRVNIYGIYKSLCFGNQQFPSKFKTVIIANNIEQIKEEEKIDLDSMEEQFLELSKRQDLYLSIAPSVYGHENIKKALALMLVGGNEVVMENGSRIRGDINILMVGDPSTAKSQMLRYVLNAIPLSVATTGKGSTGVGLTAAVVVDKDTGDKRLEAGAMVLADRGVVCIDEFDKMNDGDRVAVHEVMEQQTVTVAKAGMHTTLNARCSVLAAANPIWGQYKESRPPQDNVRLPESLLTRFDLIFITLDKSSTQVDQKISEHVLKMHALNGGYAEEGIGIDQKLLRGYFQYCKKRRPSLSREAASLIIKEYTLLRQDKRRQKEQIVTVTPRVLETMIRLATANAKLRLSDVVEYSDAETVIELMKESLFQKVIKPEKRIRVEPVHVNDEFDLNEEKGTLRRDLEGMAVSEERRKYINGVLYNYSADQNNPRVLALQDLINRMDPAEEITEQEVRIVLEELAEKDLILFEGGRIYLIN